MDTPMIVCDSAGICDWNGHSWSDCWHDEPDACGCQDGPCRYCEKDREQAAARRIEFGREMEEADRA